MKSLLAIVMMFGLNAFGTERITTLKPQDIVGTYSNPSGDRTVTISQDQQGLQIQINSGFVETFSVRRGQTFVAKTDYGYIISILAVSKDDLQITPFTIQATGDFSTINLGLSPMPSTDINDIKLDSDGDVSEISISGPAKSYYISGLKRK